MEPITSILQRKEARLYTVSPESYVTDALQQMRSGNVDYLVVINTENRFLGILTDHDIATKIIFGNKPLHKTFVREIMNTRLPVVTTTDTVEKCMRTMQQHNVRFLPVFDGFDFRGVVSSDDIIHEVVENRMEIFDEEEDQSHTFA
ncbi:MAG TPA: CBS domain-containing protein [Chitinophagaceae bacterium]|jgi:CBS domain-containing protein